LEPPCATATNGLQVLHGVTGSCRAGRVTAIMGPSGAGKTTFMNTLAGRASYGATTGTVLINGARDTVHNYSAFVGFVPQDDIMLRELTVYETLRFYAHMRLPRDMAHDKRAALVADVIDSLGLRHIAHSPIGDETRRGISGGQ
jgi:ABC-type multidrug transport system ATPase subunit